MGKNRFMAGLSYKDSDRFLLSTVFAVILHIIVFIGLHIILNIKVETLPEYSGPLYLEIGDGLIQDTVIEEEKEKIEETVDEQTTIAEKDKTDKPDTDKRQSDVVKRTDEQKKNTSPDVVKTTDEQKKDTSPVVTEKDDKEETADADEFETGENLGDYESADKDKDSSTRDTQAQPTPGPSSTSKPYNPALEEDNLTLLDKILDNGDSGETGDNTSSDSTDTNDTVAAPDGGPRIEWEDNQNRTPLITYDPEIPDWVKKEGKSLRVEVSFLLTPDGLLISLRIRKSSGYTDVDSSIVAALRKWKFPSISGTKNVSGWITYFIGVK